jgi:hypothetical protein
MPARTFYLNEQHELSRGEREGGGRVPQYSGIDWGAKGRGIKTDLARVREIMAASQDPLASQKYYLVATPVETIEKKSRSKQAREGVLSDTVQFGKDESRVFRRLGVDLVDVLAVRGETRSLGIH